MKISPEDNNQSLYIFLTTDVFNCQQVDFFNKSNSIFTAVSYFPVENANF